VHATLLDTYVSGHARFGTRLRPAEVELFYREYRRLGRLIGVRERDLPPTWAAFRAYFDQKVADELVRTESVGRVLETIRHAPPPPIRVPSLAWQAVRVPASRALWLGGIGLMSPTLRRRLGISWRRLDEAQFRSLGRASRALGPLLPPSLRVTGPAQLRWRRDEIERGPLGGQSPTE
jgi:uncharacterized protein (DUF2236 family)